MTAKRRSKSPEPEEGAQRPSLAVLGLGANLGEPLSTLRRAADALENAPGLEPIGRSGVYCSAPLGGPPQPDYLNAAVSLHCCLEPLALLETCLRIERELGRIRPDAVRWGPRSIDIDLLWLSCGVVDEAELRVPHLGLPQRAFALRPLLDLVPEASDPVSLRRYADLPAAQSPIRRLTAL